MEMHSVDDKVSPNRIFVSFQFHEQSYSRTAALKTHKQN